MNRLTPMFLWLSLAPTLILGGCGIADMGKAATAVDIWRQRGQLPLPDLPAGTSSLTFRGDWPANVISPPNMAGGHIVELWVRGSDRHEELLARYHVAWTRMPRTYHLIAADALGPAAGPMAVTKVKPIAASELDAWTGSKKSLHLLDDKDLRP